MKHRTHQLITVSTKYTLNVTSLRRYTKITVWVFTVRKISSGILSYRYKNGSYVAFKIRQNPFPATALPRPDTLWKRGAQDTPHADRLVGWEGDPSPYSTPLGTDPPSALAMCPPEFQPDLRLLLSLFMLYSSDSDRCPCDRCPRWNQRRTTRRLLQATSPHYFLFLSSPTSISSKSSSSQPCSSSHCPLTVPITFKVERSLAKVTMSCTNKILRIARSAPATRHEQIQSSDMSLTLTY